MQRLACTAPALSAALIASFAAASHASAQYTNGFEWNRAADWLEGVEHGSSANNPGPDAAGTAVWSYEAVRGGALDSADPWYAQPTTPMTWDSHWWASGHGVWSLGDNVNPPISADRLVHNLGAKNHENMPLVRWTNPAGDGALVDVAGSLRILWTGSDFIGAPTDVDVAIGLYDASTGATGLLFSTTASKPSDGLSVGDFIDLAVEISSIAMDAGDSIIVSARGHDILPGHWIALHDAGMAMTLVPGPGAAGFLLGTAAFVSRRRREGRPHPGRILGGCTAL
jgi:hypothetical protein